MYMGFFYGQKVVTFRRFMWNPSLYYNWIYMAEFIFVSELSRLHHNMFLVCKGINMIGTLGVTEKSHWVTSHI